MEYRKNDILEVTITDMSENGEGIGKVDGYTLFVKDAIIGDTVKAGLTKVKKNYAFARIDKLIKPSDIRIVPPCEYHRQCGGCQIMAMSYEAQLEYKAEKVKNDLVRIGGFERDYIDSISEPIIGMESPYRYRNKAQYPIGRTKDGHITAGFYAGRTHSIISNKNCYLGAIENEAVLDAVIGYMNETGETPYDEATGKGTVRHVLIRKGFKTGEIMVCIVINADSLTRSDVLIDRLRTIDGMTSISININKKNTNVILGDTVKTLWGSDTIMDFIGNVQFKISPLSFYQVNPVQTEKLYRKALEYAYGESIPGCAGMSGVQDGCNDAGNVGTPGDEGAPHIWDLYCGIGTISLFLAQKAAHVTGIEIVPQAIDDARENAKLNNAGNVTFYTGAAEDLAPLIVSGEINRTGDALGYRGNDYNYQRPDVIVVDPPRKGCDERLLDTILSVQPDKVVYVSCDPATLSRDLKILCDSGSYTLTRVCPVDQFPNTVHVETVCLLSKVQK